MILHNFSFDNHNQYPGSKFTNILTMWMIDLNLIADFWSHRIIETV